MFACPLLIDGWLDLLHIRVTVCGEHATPLHLRPARVIPRPVGHGLRYQDSYKTLASATTLKPPSQSQKQRLRHRRLAWEQTFRNATLYLVQDTDDPPLTGEVAPWFAQGGNVEIGRQEIGDKYGPEVGAHLYGVECLQDLVFDPSKGLVVCVEGLEQPLFEVCGDTPTPPPPPPARHWVHILLAPWAFLPGLS